MRKWTKPINSLAKMRAKVTASTLTAKKEIPIYLQIIATARRHGEVFATPAEAYFKRGVPKETAMKYEIARLSSQGITKLTREQLIGLARENIAQAYRKRNPNPTAAPIRRK